MNVYRSRVNIRKFLVATGLVLWELKVQVNKMRLATLCELRVYIYFYKRAGGNNKRVPGFNKCHALVFFDSVLGKKKYMKFSEANISSRNNNNLKFI